MFHINNLSYSISSNSILKNLQLSVQPGHFYALAGENGAGKSTLIKIMLDLIRNIDSGEITINGFDNKDISSREQLCYLPEKFDIKRDVTGWQYIEFVHGIYKQDINKQEIEALCDTLTFDVLRLGDKAHNYSKGMKQKLGLVSCFMLDKPLVILDEPLSGLDPKARYAFKQLLQQEKMKNRTVFYSTHMLADAEEICDQFGILHQGKIVFDGSPQDCVKQFEATNLEQAYINCINVY